jgi:prolyl oligopeptidase
MASSSSALAWTPHCYPHTRRSDHVDVYRSGAGEVKVSDPYVWLEKDGEEQEKWLAAQEALARNFLDAHPDRVKLEEEIRASTDYEKVSSSLMRSSDRMKRSIIVRPPHTAG